MRKPADEQYPLYWPLKDTDPRSWVIERYLWRQTVSDHCSSVVKQVYLNMYICKHIFHSQRGQQAEASASSTCQMLREYLGTWH